MHFGIADKGTVYALREAGAWRHIQHVALAQQCFRPHLVKYGA